MIFEVCDGKDRQLFVREWGCGVKSKVKMINGVFCLDFV